MDMTPAAAKELLEKVVACKVCLENAEVGGEGFFKRAVDNAHSCAACCKKVVDKVLDEAGCGPLNLR